MDGGAKDAVFMESLIYENMRLNETVRKLETRLREQEDSANRFGTIAVMRDRLADIMSVEQARREKYLERMLAAIQDWVIICDGSEHVAYCSESFLRAAGAVSFGLVDGRPFEDVIAGFCDGEFVKRAMDRLKALKAQKRLRGDVVDIIDYGHGLHRFYVINEIPMFGEGGVFDGFLMVYHDTTELLAAKESAEAANKAKSSFLATMSHEIRTPLNAIIGLSEIEMQKRLPPDAYANLKNIYGAGLLLLGIINDILDISKIEIGNLELVEAEYGIIGLINDVVQLNIIKIGEKDVGFEMDLSETLPAKLCGDALRVKQVLNNILSNAFEYTNKGAVTLKIDWKLSGEDAELKFVVSDTGIGIRREDISKLFSEYRRVDSRANRNVHGAGLGLSISKNLALLMGGSIEVESEYGAGSSFTVKILQKIKDFTPIGVNAAQKLKNLDFTGRGAAPRIARAFMPYGKVLIVDDVITNLDVARGLMLPYGLSIDCVTSGIEAVERVRAVCGGVPGAQKYDVIFMDHMMPEMDGIEAMRAIRGGIDSEYARTVPIIALTANALIGNEEMFMASGFDGFIPKPMDIARLDEMLNRFIRDRQSEETLRRAETEAETMLGGFGRGKLAGFLIDGLDLAAGAGLYDDESIYIGVLRSFAQHTPALLERLTNPSEENLRDYMINAHGIKGACRGISAYGLAAVAESLENAAKIGDLNFVRRNNNRLLESGQKLVSDVQSLIESLSAGGASKNLAREPDAATLAAMLDASRNYDTLAMESAMTDLENYEYERGGETVTRLRKLSENLEYEAIEGLLKELISGESYMESAD